MAPRSEFAEVTAPDGRGYLIGSGGFARNGGPFSIVVYPFGRAERAVLGSRPTHVEPVRSGAFGRRIEELTEAIQSGTWTPPELSDEERTRLENRAAKREARRAWARSHPVASTAKSTAHIAFVVLIFFAMRGLVDLLAGRTPGFPSPLGLLAFLAAWFVLLSGFGLWSARRRSTRAG
jgi:hypothetical protein